MRPAGKGQRYKFHIVPRGGGPSFDKADPHAFKSETAPLTASIVWDLDYEWHDATWMAERHARNSINAPISIYEVASRLMVPLRRGQLSLDRAAAGRLTSSAAASRTSS